MKASEIRFEEFLSQPKTNFLIPVYQRNYDWLNTQCNEFIQDIEVLEQGLKEYIIIEKLLNNIDLDKNQKCGLEDDDVVFYVG